MVKEVTMYKCACHQEEYRTKEEAENCEIKTAVCHWCKKPIKNPDWSHGNAQECKRHKGKMENEAQAGLNALFG